MLSVVWSVVRSTIGQWLIVSSHARDIQICQHSCICLVLVVLVVKWDFSEYQQFLTLSFMVYSDYTKQWMLYLKVAYRSLTCAFCSQMPSLIVTGLN